MSEETPPGVRVLEAHEEFKQHIEAGASKVTALGLITMVVAFLLLASYFSQLLLPYVGGTRYQTVDLLNPALVVTQILLMILTAAWLYVGAVNYLFGRRLGRTVREIRASEKQLEKRIFGE
ncbi:MAG: hypothetical protein HYY68_06810 [Thaumarchaeota archaeon]|nr:hypothetical protein [Nitrososphaerota archaeon]MBI3023421.1 hypothetical protein [Nitrososphaerota archaeon]